MCNNNGGSKEATGRLGDLDAFEVITLPNGHLYRVTYTTCRIDRINSPDDGHMDARNM